MSNVRGRVVAGVVLLGWFLGTMADSVHAQGGSGPHGAPAGTPSRGYVVYVETDRIAIDLTAVDGVRAGTIVGVRRDGITIVHPLTGEVLGQLEGEVGTARVTETREKFSVAEIQTLAPGARIQVRDRVVVKPKRPVGPPLLFIPPTF